MTVRRILQDISIDAGAVYCCGCQQARTRFVDGEPWCVAFRAHLVQVGSTRIRRHEDCLAAEAAYPKPLDAVRLSEARLRAVANRLRAARMALHVLALKARRADDDVSGVLAEIEGDKARGRE